MSNKINEIVNGVIQTKPLNPAANFIHGNDGALSAMTVEDYWRWAHSDIIVNTNRGALAEFIVAKAIGSRSEVRDTWAAYDLETPTGIRVEVKSSAYLQTWYQKALASPAFGIRKTLGWDPETGKYGEESRRQADVYVFCLLAHTGDKTTLNPLDLAQWEFYVVGTKVIDFEFGEKEGVSISQVREITRARTVDEIAKAVDAEYAGRT